MLTVAGRVRRGVKNGGQLLGGSGVSCSSQTWDIANQGVLLVAAASRRLFGSRPASRWSGIVLHKELFCSSREAARRRLDSWRDAGATKELQQAN
jgi:hypothetical protein